MFGTAQSAPSLFGSAQQQTTSLFGAASSASLFGGGSTTQSSSPFLFGGAAPQSNPTSLFGGAPPASSSSLFGGGAASSASLFGGAPASSTSLFGAPASSTSLFGAPASSSSLFGAPASSSALFGASASSSSLFGAPASSSSLFGAASSSSLFGQPSSGPSLFGGGAPGTTPLGGVAPQGSAQQAQQIEITLRTRISELPQNFQTDLFAVERHLREQRNKASSLWAKRGDVDAKLSQTRSKTSDISRLLVKLRSELEAFQANANSLKSAIRTERGSAEPVVIALENLSHRGYSGYLDQNGLPFVGSDGQMQAAHVPDEYFTRVVEGLEARATEYKAEIDDVAEFLKAQGIVLSSGASGFGNGMNASLLDNLSQRYMDIGVSKNEFGNIPRGRTIEDIIRRQYEYFMVVASHIANVSENLRAVKEQYLQVLRERDSDVLNPFQQADMREKVEKDRQRLLAEKRAAAGALDFGNGTKAAPQSSAATGSVFGNVGTSSAGSSSAAGALTTQPSLFQSSGTSGSLFGGASTAGAAASSGGGLFGGGGFSFGGSTAAAGADGDAKRATRRKRD